MVNWPEVVAYLQSCPPARAKEQLLRLAMGKCRVRAVKPKIRLPKGQKKESSFPALKRKAWDVFSKWIRQRDADENGFCKCCTCPEIRHWKGMDAGHFKSRIYENTLFDEQNVHAQCKGCNMPPNNGRPIEYSAFLEEKYCQGMTQILNLRAGRRKLERAELLDIIAKYSAKPAEGGTNHRNLPVSPNPDT